MNQKEETRKKVTMGSDRNGGQKFYLEDRRPGGKGGVEHPERRGVGWLGWNRGALGVFEGGGKVAGGKKRFFQVTKGRGKGCVEEKTELPKGGGGARGKRQVYHGGDNALGSSGLRGIRIGWKVIDI